MKLVSQKKKNTIVVVSIIAAILVVALVVGAIVFLTDLFKTEEDNTPPVDLGIQISRQAKTEYVVGEKFDASNIIVQLLSTKQEGVKLLYEKDLTFSGFDSSAPCEGQVITVKYGEFVTHYTVNIREKSAQTTKTLESVKLADGFRTTYPKDWWNSYGPTIRGAKLVCTYSDGSSEEIDLLYEWCDGVNLDIQAPGETQFTIKYKGFEITVTVTITE